VKICIFAKKLEPFRYQCCYTESRYFGEIMDYKDKTSFRICYNCKDKINKNTKKHEEYLAHKNKKLPAKLKLFFDKEA